MCNATDTDRHSVCVHYRNHSTAFQSFAIAFPLCLIPCAIVLEVRSFLFFFIFIFIFFWLVLYVLDVYVSSTSMTSLSFMALQFDRSSWKVERAAERRAGGRSSVEGLLRVHLGVAPELHARASLIYRSSVIFSLSLAQCDFSILVEKKGKKKIKSCPHPCWFLQPFFTSE